jgi:hypothetical protein
MKSLKNDTSSIFMLFEDSLIKVYTDAGFDNPECIDEINSIYREIRSDNERAGVGEKWPAHAMLPYYPHVEKTTLRALEIMAANSRCGSEYSDQDFADLAIAGVGHDIGYRIGPADHESVGMEMTDKFLTRKGFPRERINRITSAIGFTKVFGDKPEETELGRILAAGDALGIISDPEYFSVYLPLLFKEFGNWITDDGRTKNEELGYKRLDGADGIRGPKSAKFIRKVLYPAVEPYMENFDKVYGEAISKMIQKNLELLDSNNF